EGLRVAHDERVVHAVPQRLLALRRAPRERRLGAPLADPHHEPVAPPPRPPRAAGSPPAPAPRPGRMSGAPAATAAALPARFRKVRRSIGRAMGNVLRSSP